MNNNSTDDPFSLLSPAGVNQINIQIYKGDGNTFDKVFDLYDEDANEYYELIVEVSSQVLYFNLNGVPTRFQIEDKWLDADYCGYQEYETLVDGFAELDGCYTSDESQYYKQYQETLSIAKRRDFSSYPIALVHKKFGDDDDYHYETDFTAAVVFFDGTKNKRGSLFEADRVSINDRNNDFYEGVFQYDINGDNRIPLYTSPPKNYVEKLSRIKGRNLIGNKDNNTYKGSNKNDLIDGKRGDDILDGNKGNDIIYGGHGVDQLYGNSGNDFLDGRQDDDLLVGGSGFDVFKLSGGNDTIVDFRLKQDKIAIPKKYIGNFSIESTNGSATVSVAGFGRLVLNNIGQEQLNKAYDKVFMSYVDPF